MIDTNPCGCPYVYTIESDTLFYGRCNHRHGYNLCRVSEVSYNMLEILNNENRSDDDVQ